MRLVFGIILTIAGSLLLVENFQYVLIDWDYLFDFWPLIFIIWGISFFPKIIRWILFGIVIIFIAVILYNAIDNSPTNFTAFI